MKTIKKILILWFITIASVSYSQEVITQGMTGLQLRNALNTNFDTLYQANWDSIANGISYDNNVTVGDILFTNGVYSNKYVNIDTVGNSESDTLFNQVIYVEPTINKQTGLKTIYGDRTEIIALEGDTLGKVNLISNYCRIFNYNDSINGDIIGSQSQISNQRGYVDEVIGTRSKVTTSPVSDTSRIRVLTGIELSSSIIGSIGAETLVDVDEMYGINSFQSIGNGTKVNVGYTANLKISTDIKAAASSTTTIGTLAGLDLTLNDLSIGTVNLDNNYGIYLANNSSLKGSLLNYGIYEDFGDNYFTNKMILESEIVQTQLTAVLTDGTPTDSEIDIATSLTPTTAGVGYQITIKDSDGTGLLYRIESDGTDWFYTVMAKAL